MQLPAEFFNSHVGSSQLQKDAFVTRMYGTNNQRGPYMYPRSPYALGDIAPMNAMAPIDASTLFTQTPTQGIVATSTAPIGSAGFPTFRASAPIAPGTILGPDGASVPFDPGMESYTSPYGDPAATLDEAASGQKPAGPITYTNPWPSIVQPPPTPRAAPVSEMCKFGEWVNRNPGLALLGTVGVFLFFKGGKKR